MTSEPDNIVLWVGVLDRRSGAKNAAVVNDAMELRIAIKMRERHPDISARAYSNIPEILSRGYAFKDRNSPK